MRKSWLFLLLLVFPSVCLRGQTGNGSIQGTVTDPSGGLVAGAVVTIRNLATGTTMGGDTSSAGVYDLPNVPPGSYELTLDAPGFKKFAQSPVSVEIGVPTHLDVSLQLGTVTQEVRVTANAPQLRPDTSTISSTVSSEFVENLPLDASGTIRNPVQFLEVTPGFRGSTGNTPFNNSDDQFKMNGGQENSTDILVDGVSIALSGPNLQWNKGVSPEGVAEFTTLENNFAAEYGESGDSIVTLSLKSGTNQLHGSAYDYAHNRALDAASWADNTLGVAKPNDTQNDFGFSVGGPVVLPHVYNGRDRTFFFFDYEGYRLSVASTGLASIPPQSFENGDFSGLLPGVQLYDPTTQQPITGDILTNDPNFTSVSSVMSKVYATAPPPTYAGLVDNYVESSTSYTRGNVYDFKMDQNISNKQHFSASFDLEDMSSGYTTSLNPIYSAQDAGNTKYFRLSDSYAFSPTLFNLFSGGFTRMFYPVTNGSLGGNWPSKLGLKGVQDFVFPCINLAGTTYGQFFSSCGDDEFAYMTFQYNDAVTWVRGHHTMKFGGEVRDLQFNARELTYTGGDFTYSNRETANASGVGGYAMASADFGLVDQLYLPFGTFHGIRYKDYSFFAQDTYKLARRLTLNYGLRYDVDLPAGEAFDRISMVDPTLPNPAAGNILGAYTYFGTGPGRNGRTRPQNIYRGAFGPRVGVAYEVNNKTVVRTGYGIYYEPNKEDSYADEDDLGFFNTESLTYGLGTPFQIDNGVPITLPPSGPLTPSGQNGSGGVLLVPANSGRPGNIQNWNFDVQRQISANLLVDVAYVGSKGTHLVSVNEIPNQVNPQWLPLGSELTMNVSCLTSNTCPNSIAAGVHLPYPTFTGSIGQALRPFPQYGDFNEEDNSFSPDRDGNSTYHAMELQVRKRFSQGLNLMASYTISKDITDADSLAPGAQGFIGDNAYIGQNSYDRRAEKSLSNLDTPQRFVAAYYYELPLGRGKHFLSHPGLANRLVSKWYVSGIQTYQSGTPVQVYASCSGTAGQVLFAGCELTGASRVNIVSGVPQTNKSSSFNAATTPFYNSNAFSVPAPFTFGDASRALNARSFAGLNEDLVVGKKTALYGERVVADFRAEFFDAFNRHIYTAPTAGGLGGTPLGSIPFEPAFSTNCPGPIACGFGAVTGSSGPRTMQMGLRIIF
jgi:hypothetical protein